ncbi:MAG: ABC transporter substrate-binding protein [Chitinophaga sp.]|uniref:ABC transporter substrate-binding protein n=1 Tax=Chitinophaga sp. TaxID=1869181 RepID=UPI0025C428CF|nr:ABC transporter substrate-binding protein [Chitinophaga sp.]MBV8255974.1 ABC transporter substrate-binding protein [Chitinophaga sp.]
MFFGAPLTIGFLTPYSSVYPYFGPHLMTGWLLGMGLDPVNQKTVQFVPEFTYQGGAATTTDAARKLIYFNRVDVVSGLIGYKSVTDIIPMLEKEKGTGFFFDMGEYIPHFPYLSPNVYYASNQLWQSQYALGQWAMQRFGEGGEIISPLYEAGYHLSPAFVQGVKDAGGAQPGINVIPFDQGQPMKLELDEYFQKWEKEHPAYVHAIFCGNLGINFLQKWMNSGLLNKVPLILHEAMAYDDMLEDIKEGDVNFYTARSWMREDERKENLAFVKAFEHYAKQPANIFALMGYEAGLIWKELLPYAVKKDFQAVRQLLQSEVVRGPRGDKNYYPQSGFALPDSNIIKISITNKHIRKIIVDQGKGLRYDAKEFQEIHEQSVSGWQNPFLCI